MGFYDFKVVHDQRFAGATLATRGNGRGKLCVSAAVGITWRLPMDGGLCVVAKTQLVPSSVDRYLGGKPPSKHNDEPTASITWPAAIVPHKPVTDVVLVGDAWSSVPVTHLTVTLRIGPLAKTLSVTGDRRWYSQGIASGITDPVAFTRMPLVYERAYGGVPPSQRECYNHWPREAVCERRNPVGTGFAWTWEDWQGMALPNIEMPGHLVETPQQQPPPVAGFGAVAPSWMPRALLRPEKMRTSLDAEENAGLFHSCAAEGLSMPGYLSGPLSIELENLSRVPRLAFTVPAVEVQFMPRRDDLALGPGKLWLVVIEPNNERVFTVWGAHWNVDDDPRHGVFDAIVRIEGE